MESSFAEYHTPCGDGNRTQTFPSARTEEYVSDSDLTVPENQSVVVQEDLLIAGRNKFQRRKIIKAKRRIFTSTDGAQSARPFVFRSTPAQNGGQRNSIELENNHHPKKQKRSSNDNMSYVEQWIIKHIDEFERYRGCSPVNSVPVPKPTPLQPTHEMVWVNALLPAQMEGARDRPVSYINRLIPLLVPIGTSNLPLTVVNENQQLFTSIINQIDRSQQ